MKNVYNAMRVLSLFDGMSCGQIALKEIGITPEVYYASEIDKFAIKQTQLNFPNTIQVGDVRDLNVEDLGHIDLILADTPGRFTPYTIGYQAFKSKEEALKYAEEQRTDLIKSLKLQIHELENLKFEYDD